MGNSNSREEEDDSGTLLQVVLRLHENQSLPSGLVPHVLGASQLAGGWDAARAVPMERESNVLWELRLVLPANHDVLDFKFLLKPPEGVKPCLLEVGHPRKLVHGALQGGRMTARFQLASPDDNYTTEFLELPVSVRADELDPFSLAGAWKTHVDALSSHGSMVRGFADVSVEGVPPTSTAEEDRRYNRQESLPGDPEEYEVPPPTSLGEGYVADTAEEPQMKRSSTNPPSRYRGLAQTTHPRVVSIKDLVLLNEEAQTKQPPRVSGMDLLDTIPVFEDEGICADSPLPMQDSPPPLVAGMPEAAGAVAAAAVSERMLGPKERRRLAIVLVGLPARGKTFTAAKLARYLRWLGHDTKHFNVGKYRRSVLGSNQSSDFFRADNPEGVEARNEVAGLAFQDMLAWMHEGGQVGVFDATNSTKERRNYLLRLAEGKCKVIFLETICNDPVVLEQNIREKVKKSPDYAHERNMEVAYADFKSRLANYEKAYEPVEEGSYIKLIDMVSGSGGQMQVNNISGYLPGRIVFFLVNTHISPRPILLTRHGESMDNVRGRIGGDPGLSDLGEMYAKKLAEFVFKRLKNEQAASIWTSTLQRTVLSAKYIQGFPKVQWRALDEINAGVCDGMTYQEIKDTMPEEYQARKADKLRYRYPRGESYLDVIQRLEPVIIELERQRAPVVVVAHQAVLRALYAYFMDKPLREIPHIEMPLHTIIELTAGVSGITEKRFQLMDSTPH